MKRLRLGIPLIFAFCASVFAQTGENLTCPTISISGPAGIVEPGEIGNYSAQVDAKGQALAIEYFWTTSSGKIVGGQGTPNIEVELPVFNILTLVTIKIKGFPDGCPNTAIESVPSCDGLPTPVKLDEFFDPALAGNKPALDKIVVAMNDNPNDQLYVFFAYKKGTLRKSMSNHQEKVFKYLTAAGLDGSRITFHSMENRVELVQFWRVPPGAGNPTCPECETPR